MCNPHKPDEYVDYSCSTAVERLTRDVESLLRSWHIHDGCDRHFSVNTNPNGLTLLRAERLTWIAALPGRRSLRLELELALWDGPASRAPKRTRRKSDNMNVKPQSLKVKKKKKKQSANNRRSSVSNDECLQNAVQAVCSDDSLDCSNHTVMSGSLRDHLIDEEREVHNHLPKSLQRPQHPADVTDMPESLFDNFSTMFGIGQHITLAPTNPSMDLGIDNGEPNNMTNASSALSYLCKSLLGRHKPSQARWVLTQLIASWMQTALNCAAINCQSCLPVFGVWGNYPSASLPSSDEPSIAASYWNQGQTQAKASIPIFPPWFDAALTLRQPIDSAIASLQAQQKSQSQLSFSSRRRRKGKKSPTNADASRALPPSMNEPWIQNAVNAPPVITGSVIPTTDIYANFTCAVLPQTILDGPVDRLSTWGNLLLRHCESSTSKSTSVVLTAARHVYAWSKSKTPTSEATAWRGIDPKEYWKQQQSSGAGSEQKYLWGTAALPPTPSSSLVEEIEDYRYACRAQALLILEQATGPSCWGPRCDPIYALQATVGWKSQFVRSTFEAVGSFSSHTQALAYDASASLLDPKRASLFQVQTFLDHQALEPTLATTQRCILACLIRTSTLAPLTLLRHLLWEEDIVEEWDHIAGNRAALQVARKAYVGEATKTLVDVMDWKTCAEEMISEKEAEKIVREVFEGTASFGFPSPPEDMFSPENKRKGCYNKSHPLLEPLFQSAPVGRLVSDLCARMAQLRTPCSMALVWSTFCNELRQRSDIREPVPHMNFVPGLDPSPDATADRRKLSTIGVKADLAAFLNCSEADPDDQHCLIGQKLQVFNIGIETMGMVEEGREQQQGSEESRGRVQWDLDLDDCRQPRDGSGSPTPARANSSVSLASDGDAYPQERLDSTSSGKGGNPSTAAGLQLPGRLQLPAEFFNGNARSDYMPKGSAYSEDEEEMSLVTGGDSMSEFFDCKSIFTSRSVFTRNMASATVIRIERLGARCPLHGCSLVANGDQVYAPYLRRPEPLTDDVILERRTMLSEIGPDDERNPIQKRLEIAYRLQKPKLLSDMNAFKAANPGAVFQDFVSWYGNPGNPLEDYCNPVVEKPHFSGLASAESVAMKLDKATEAIHILNETRNFWSSTWEESVPLPASEQNSLFDVFHTVERTLDYLENMHPAILLNQIMAVTTSNSYFLLVASAKDAVKIPIVEAAIRGVRENTEKVLVQLADEASNATHTFYNMQSEAKKGGTSFVSIDTIKACEEVCACFSETEVLIALATSLLQKFPGQYETVQSVLKHADGDKIKLEDSMGQSRILDAIARQQPERGGGKGPSPVLREYLLRNLDDSNPCQMSVRYGDASLGHDDVDAKGKVGLLVALTNSHSD